MPVVVLGIAAEILDEGRLRARLLVGRGEGRLKRERRHGLEAAAAAVVSAVVRRLPRRVVLATGRRLGRLWAALDPRHLAIAADNLRQAFPDWDEARVQATARGVYAHFATVLLDILWMEGRPVAELLALADVEGLEHLTGALARGLGVVFPPGPPRQLGVPGRHHGPARSAPRRWSRARSTTRRSTVASSPSAPRPGTSSSTSRRPSPRC